VLIIAIVAVAMIGIMIPSAFAGTYVNEGNYEFSIDYPYGWEMLEEEYPNLVSFSDKYDWTTAIFVSHWEDAGEQLTDDEEIDWMFELLEDQCVNNIVGTTGINCFNFQRYDDTAMVYEINGYRAITVMTSNTNQYGNPDYPGNYPMVWTFTHIYDGYDVWQISSESEDYVFDKHLDSIAELVESFRIGDVTASTTTFIPSSNASYKIYFEELPEWSEFNVDSAVRDATNYWNARDGITFSRTYDANDADMYVSWIKNYGHNVLGTYIQANIDVGLGDDFCAGTWQPFSQQTASETLTHEIGHHLGYDDIDYSPDTTDIMAYSNSNVSRDYEKWSETSMIGYTNAIPVCTYENGITYDYKLTSDSNHTYDVFFVPSITEYDKFINGDDYRSACSTSDVRNTSGSCKVNSNWFVVVSVSGGSNDTLAEFELTLSETNLPGTSTTTSLPPITKNDTPIDYDTTQTITTSNDFFSAQGNDFTTITITGFVPEQFVKNHLPVYLAITHEGIMIDELKVTATSQGKFSVPFQLSPDASYGTYVITGRNSIASFGSTTFSYGISENVTPPSVSSNYDDPQQNLGQNNLSEFTQFTSNHHGFSIDYPSNWSYEEDYACYDEDEVCMLSFADDLDYWSTSVNVNFNENYFGGYTWSSDNQFLEDWKASIYDECINSRDYYDYSCEDYRLHRADTMTINGLKSYVVEFSEKDVYDDGSYENLHIILVEIPTGGDAAWNIYSDTVEEYSEYNLPLIEQSISSFILHDVNTQESVSTPIQESVSTPIQEIENNMCGEGTITKNGICVAVCGDGTVYKDGKCQVVQTTSQTSEEKGGGCLIATATYGSEMAPQVQQLRELRDNQLLNTESGTAFMEMFNDIYYTFSPTIADMERENPYFKEAVKLAITPMISTLSLMENANSESEVLGIGISVIMLNLGMYLAVPAIVVIGIRKKF
jgi:hypothetical protein